MTRPCRHCRRPFTPTRKLPWYCGPECQQAAFGRTCTICGKEFTVRQVTQKGYYCSLACRREADRLGLTMRPAREAARRLQVQQGRIAVACRWDACPRKGELISTPRCHPHRYHRECWRAYQKAGGPNKGKGKGRVLVCQACGGEIGYRKPSRAHQRWCGDCAPHAPWRRSGYRKNGEMRPCAWCQADVYVAAWRLRRQGRIFCCREHADAWRRAQAHVVTCVSCGTVRRYMPRRLPPAVDRETMTWTCPGCRLPNTVVRDLRCAHCHTGFRRRVPVAAQAELRFCSLTCRRQYYPETRRRAAPCASCGGIIRRRGRHPKKYCSWQCYVSAARGRPRRHARLSPAARDILAAWHAGVRGVRKLAHESGRSINTVRKLQQAGLLADAQPAHPPRSVLEDVS